MKITTEAVVLRQRSIDEKDRLLTLLTRERGVVRAYARGAGAMKSALLSSTELLCYSHFVLFHHKERYSVDSADGNTIFFGVRQDVEKLALGSYMAQLCEELIPEGAEDESFLRLMLNSLHMLDKGLRSVDFIKPLFELRLLSMSGYLPDLVACRGCACFESDPMYFLPHSGSLCCPACLGEQELGTVALSPSLLAAMRHIVYSPFEKLYSFTLPPGALAALSRVTQAYLTARVERSFTSLEFYQAVHLHPANPANPANPT